MVNLGEETLKLVNKMIITDFFPEQGGNFNMEFGVFTAFLIMITQIWLFLQRWGHQPAMINCEYPLI